MENKFTFNSSTTVAGYVLRNPMESCMLKSAIELTSGGYNGPTSYPAPAPCIRVNRTAIVKTSYDDDDQYSFTESEDDEVKSIEEEKPIKQDVKKSGAPIPTIIDNLADDEDDQYSFTESEDDEVKSIEEEKPIKQDVKNSGEPIIIEHLAADEDNSDDQYSFTESEEDEDEVPVGKNDNESDFSFTDSDEEDPEEKPSDVDLKQNVKNSGEPRIIEHLAADEDNSDDQYSFTESEDEE